MSGGKKRSIDDEIDGILSGSAGDIDSEIDSALTDPSQGGRVPPEQQQPSDPSPRVVDNPQASVRAGIPEQGPPPAQNQQVEPQSKDWITGAITSLADAFRAQEEGASAREDMRGNGAGAILGGLARGASLGTWNPLQDDQAAAPGVAKVAQVAGSFANPIAALTPGAQSIAGAIGLNAASGALQGGIQGYAEGDPNDPQRAVKALKDAAVAGGVGGVLGGAGEAVSGAGGALYNRMRLKAGNVGADDLAAFMGKRNMTDANAAGGQLVSEAEQLVPPNWLQPRSPNDIQMSMRAKQGELNSGVNDALTQAQAAGAQMPPNLKSVMAGDLRQQAQRGIDASAGAPMAPALRGVAGELEGGAPLQSPQELRKLKQDYDARAFGNKASVSDENAALAAKAAADQARGALQQYVGVDPAIAAQYGAANRGYEALSPFSGGAQQQAIKNAVGQGMGAGGDGLMNKLGNYAGQAAGMEYWPDAAANAIRPVVGTADWLSQNAGTVVAQGRTASRQDIAQSLLNRGQRQAPMQTSGGSQGMENSRGDLLGDNVWALMNGPNKLALQPFAAELAKGLDPDGADDRSRFNANVERLARTNPEFKKRVMPLIGGGQ